MERHVEVIPVTSFADHRAFCRLPFQIYGNDPCWVPPLHSVEYARWSPRKNRSLRRRWCQRFVARRGSEVVGRVAAFVDEEFCRRWHAEGAFFGFFECRSDREIAAELFKQVELAVREKGKSYLLGPINLTTHDEVGLLVEGFDSSPMILSPYNPPYYESLLVACGFTPAHDYLAFRWTPESRCTESVQRLLGRAARGPVRVRSLDPARWEQENRTLLRLYNCAFDRNWGFVPLSWEEYLQRAKSVRPFYRPQHVAFAEINGNPVGFALTLPNVHEALTHVRGRLFPCGWLRLARSMRQIRGLRLILLGVLPDVRGLGIAVLLADHQLRAARRDQASHAELSLVQDGNRRMEHVIQAFGGEKCKTYRLFAKSL